ncbi:hypothetical protein NA56DRAFT_218041 [Hyaloscypha hepaticicola]|uniref:Uncharacterized protein n=1 Tax=Hyaloscypha hepaticicola TaxID=2082293 RepID=A0A2J6PXV1_9HELO|nr:hypothetical protein NA56DRAFT_218041 [Hyaloscypha hepaticicola]
MRCWSRSLTNERNLSDIGCQSAVCEQRHEQRVHTNSNTFIPKILCRFSIQAKVSVPTMWWSPEVKRRTLFFSLPSSISACLSFFLVVLDRYSVSLLRTLDHLEHAVHQAGIFPMLCR